MNAEIYEDKGAIVLFVSLPDCCECRKRVTDILLRMNCWKDIRIGYPSEYGSAVELFYDKNDKETDFWQLAEEAKNILQRHCYRLL